MPVTLDISDDFIDVVDNLEAVVVRPPEEENANDELLANGRFDSSLTGWTPGGATWEERLALADLNGEYLAQEAVTVAGVDYVLSADVFGVWTSTAPSLRIGTAANGSQIGSNSIAESGRLTTSFEASGTATWITLRNGDTRTRFGNVSLRRSGDTAAASALRRAVSNREAAASGGKYRQGDVKWHVDASELASPPAIGATIIDASLNYWVVLAVDQQTFNNRWRCWARKLDTADVDLGYVKIQRAEYAKSEAGAQSPTWVDWAEQVRARVQPQASAVTHENGRTRLPEAVTIYTKHQFPIDNRFRIVGANGRIYNVRGYADPHRVDGLFAIEAEVATWPLN